MTSMLVALYEGVSWTSKLIGRFGRTRVSHASLVDPALLNEDGMAAEWEAWDTGVRGPEPSLPGTPTKQVPHWFGQGHSAGTFVRLYEWRIDEVDRAKLRTWMNEQVGKRYDFLGVAGFVIRRDCQAADKWECIELVVAGSYITANPLFRAADCPPSHVQPAQAAWSTALSPHGSLKLLDGDGHWEYIDVPSSPLLVPPQE